jgi:hypothetical protein
MLVQVHRPHHLRHKYFFVGLPELLVTDPVLLQQELAKSYCRLLLENTGFIGFGGFCCASFWRN